MMIAGVDVVTSLENLKKLQHSLASLQVVSFSVIRRVARISQTEEAFLEAWNNSKRSWPKFSSLLNQI